MLGNNDQELFACPMCCVSGKGPRYQHVFATIFYSNQRPNVWLTWWEKKYPGFSCEGR